MAFSQFLANIGKALPTNPGSDMVIYRRSPKAETQVIAQYPEGIEASTRVGAFQRQANVKQFGLPESSDQLDFQNTISALKEVLLPPIADEDVANLEWTLDLIDLVLLQGLQDPDNWVLPNEFNRISFVRTSLGEGVPLELILQVLLNAVRTYVWMYRETLYRFIPFVSELEEALALITSESTPSD